MRSKIYQHIGRFKTSCALPRTKSRSEYEGIARTSIILVNVCDVKGFNKQQQPNSTSFLMVKT